MWLQHPRRTDCRHVWRGAGIRDGEAGERRPVSARRERTGCAIGVLHVRQLIADKTHWNGGARACGCGARTKAQSQDGEGEGGDLSHGEAPCRFLRHLKARVRRACAAAALRQVVTHIDPRAAKGRSVDRRHHAIRVVSRHDLTGLKPRARPQRAAYLSLVLDAVQRVKHLPRCALRQIGRRNGVAISRVQIRFRGAKKTMGIGRGNRVEPPLTAHPAANTLKAKAKPILFIMFPLWRSQ